MKRMLAAAVLAGASSTLIAQGTAPVQRPPVEVRVAVVDRAGKPVMDLRPDEFEVSINVYRTPIESVTVVRPESAPPRVITLLFDDLATPASAVPRSRDVARRVVSRMGQQDQMIVSSVSGGFSKPTDDRARLLKAVESYNGFQQGFLPPDRLGEEVLGKIAAVARDLAEVPMQKVIIGIGAGWVFDTPIPPASIGRDLRREWTETVRAMAIADLSVYAIDPGGIGRAPFTATRVGFTSESGGHAFINTNDAVGAVDRVFDELTHYYVLKVADPPTGRNDDIRELEVKVKRQGTSVRARRWLPGKR